VTGAINCNVYPVEQILSSKYLNFGTENVRPNSKWLANRECLPKRTGSGDGLQGSFIGDSGAINAFPGEAWRAKRRDAQNG